MKLKFQLRPREIYCFCKEYWFTSWPKLLVFDVQRQNATISLSPMWLRNHTLSLVTRQRTALKIPRLVLCHDTTLATFGRHCLEKKLVMMSTPEGLRYWKQVHLSAEGKKKEPDSL
jgi:hypothetical protein